MDSLRLGPKQKLILEFIIKVGGVASPWHIAKALGYENTVFVLDSLERLVARGILKKVRKEGEEWKTSSLTLWEEYLWQKGCQEYPHAQTLFVLAEWVKYLE